MIDERKTKQVADFLIQNVVSDRVTAMLRARAELFGDRFHAITFSPAGLSGARSSAPELLSIPFYIVNKQVEPSLLWQTQELLKEYLIEMDACSEEDLKHPFLNN